jgi:hypothetical protein
MRTMIFAILATLALGSSVHAADQSTPRKPLHVDMSKCPKGKCDAFLAGRTNGPVPYNEPTICSRFVQGKQVQMMIKFFDQSGQELDANDQQHTKLAKAVDIICPGRHWFEEARRGRVEFCNADNHNSVLGATQIEACLGNGSCTPLPTNYICLLGADGCREAKNRAETMLRK